MYILNRYFFHRFVYLLSKSCTFPAAHVFLAHSVLGSSSVSLLLKFFISGVYATQLEQHLCVFMWRLNSFLSFSISFLIFHNTFLFFTENWEMYKKIYKDLKISSWGSISQWIVKVEFYFFLLLMLHCISLH